MAAKTGRAEKDALMTLDAVLTQLDQDLPQALNRLLDLLRIPSISTDPAYKADCARAADWLVADLQSLGFEASARATPGHPMVVAQGGQGARHVLFYGHYDVQPVDPLALWDRDPFDPEVQDGPKGRLIRGRGAADDKGQLMTFLEACRAWIAVHGALPCRITVFLEGEEESGSPSLVPFMRENAEELTADIALICDTGLFDDDTPAITTMLRGLLGEELTIHAANKDLHSGSYGGAAQNPIRVLARILAGLHDDQGRIRVPGFYDDVGELPERSCGRSGNHWPLITLGFWAKSGCRCPAGEAGPHPAGNALVAPHGRGQRHLGGYTGEGFKTVLPAMAHAKVSFRLVGQQDPLAIRAQFRAWVQAQLPQDCTVEWNDHGAGPAGHMEIDNPAFELARAALTEEWGMPGRLHRLRRLDSRLRGISRPNWAWMRC